MPARSGGRSGCLQRPAKGEEAGQRLGRGLERRGGGSRFAELVDRKDREHAVAEEFQHIPAVRLHRLGDTLEVAIQELDHLLRGQVVGERRRAPQVRGHDHRPDALATTTADLAGENPRAGLAAEVGVAAGRGRCVA